MALPWSPGESHALTPRLSPQEEYKVCPNKFGDPKAEVLSPAWYLHPREPRQSAPEPCGGRGAPEHVWAPPKALAGLSELAGPGKTGKAGKDAELWGQWLWLQAHEDGTRRGKIPPCMAEQCICPACGHLTFLSPGAWTCIRQP